MTESRIEARIRELGYELPVAPAPVAAYVPAVTSGSYVVRCPTPVLKAS